MGRRKLISDIKATDIQLAAQRRVLQLRLAERLDWVGRLPAVWRIGGGFLSGVVLQRLVMLLPLQRGRALLMTGFQLWPALLRGLRAGAQQ